MDRLAAFEALTDLLNRPREANEQIARHVAERVNADHEHFVHTAPPWAFSAQEVVEKQELLRRLAKRVVEEGLPIPVRPEERAGLQALVAFSFKHYWWAESFTGWVTRHEVEVPPGAYLCRAAHGLWSILGGEAELRRCQAPAPWHRGAEDVCGRYFVSGGTIGRPRRFCSDACAKRNWRVNQWVAHRGQEESLQD